MYNRFYVVFNNEASIDIGVKVVSRPEIPSPHPILKEHSIPGKYGNEYELEGYEDIEITINFNFIDKENIYEIFRKCKKWINQIKDNKLIFSDNSEIFYRVNYAKITSNERIMKSLGRFTVTFNCEPFAYEMEGQEEILINNEAVIYNAGDLESKPIIKIQGEGLITIKINDDTIKANVGQEIIIDSYLELSYKSDKTPQNNNIKGKYPRLKLGENTISYSGGRVDRFVIIPNWTIY
ncbi:Phage-related protein [uncultured Clostridium sp.]|uniref:distal tail protein Dit n=1 Tax=uncultured Clostridium sp. TaxID=59620 RepID=UPI0008210109|nr:distal tail protein Dit [uncultured Clostridium sp.]SCJ09760.1 Phage-related protein [uncultured Clostridium sp.]